MRKSHRLTDGGGSFVPEKSFSDILLSELIDGEGKEEGDYGGHVDETVQQHHPVMFLPSAITSPLILFPAI